MEELVSKIVEALKGIDGATDVEDVGDDGDDGREIALNYGGGSFYILVYQD